MERKRPSVPRRADIKCRSAGRAAGFFLIEALIYLVCTVLLASLIAPILSTLYTTGWRHLCVADSFFSAIVHADRIMGDISRASCDSNLWKKQEATFVIMPIANQDNSWLVTQGKLKRVTGQYLLGQQRWVAPVTSTVGSGYTGLNFVFDRAASKIRSVRFELALSFVYRITGYSAPRVGRVL